MTEGAKTGIDVKPANEWIGNILLVKYSTLTEALKVAGEALGYIEGEANVDESNGDTLSARLRRQWVSPRRAALERIRNNKP